MKTSQLLALVGIVGTFTLAGIAVWRGVPLEMALAAVLASLTQVGHLKAPKPEKEIDGE